MELNRSSMNVCEIELQRRGQMICLPYVEVSPFKVNSLHS